MDNAEVDGYLARIGATRPARPDLAALRELQLAHLRAIPFENLSIHLGEPVVLTADALYDKIVRRRRGGFCYELNGLFAELLAALGYRVDRLSARVFGSDRIGSDRMGSGRFGPPLDHLALRVDLDGSWLVDVGFGRFADAPLRLDTSADQVDATGTFRVESGRVESGRVEFGPAGLDVLLDGRPEYRLDLRPYDLHDFVPTCWWQQTSPDSHFTRTLTCSLATATGRVTLSGDRLIVTTGTDRVERVLASDAEVLAAYRDEFGMPLDRLPTLPA